MGGESTEHRAAPPVTRRTLLSATLGASASGGLSIPFAARRAAADESVRPAGGLKPVSMAMHVHASFSEGFASYEAQLHQARKHGVDVIWWTDHDFRVAAHDHRNAVRFEGMSELEGKLEWTWSEERQGDLASGSAEFVDDPHSPDEPGKAMRLTARGGADGGILWYRGTAWNSTYSVSMADTTIELDLLPEEAGPGREFVFEIQSSYHPARAGLPAGRYVLQYRIGGDKEGRSQDGLTGIVEIPLVQGKWSRISLRPVEDIQAIWPDLVAEDNSLHRLRIGVRARPDADTRIVVDRLRFDRGRGAGEPAIELRRSVLARYADEYPDVIGYESFEVSLVRHLNWIGGGLALPDLPSPPYRNNDPDLAEQMIEFIHAHGALAQWNHPLDIETPESLVRLMLERGNLGADLMEIGRPPFEGLRQVFDAAARNAAFITGVGSNDDHDGVDWINQERNNITYVWARSTAIDDLTGALRAGRAWWIDPARWRGTLDLTINDKPAMGAALITDQDRVRVTATATALPKDGMLEIIESPVDYPGPEQPVPATRSHLVASTDLRRGRYHYVVQPGDGSYLRLQVRDGAGEVAGASNPLWLLREPPPRGIPKARRLRA